MTAKHYEGKAKSYSRALKEGTIIQYFKDDATAYNAQKKDTISQKGVLNNLISAHLLPALGPSAFRITSLKTNLVNN